MYKNPQLSSQAKQLRAALKNAGIELTHSQAMEALARCQGNRTLHVAQARKNRQGIDIAELALRQAADLVFDTLGRYEGNVLGLLSEIETIFLHEEANGSRYVEERMHDIFGQPNSPRVSEAFDVFPPADLPKVFARTRRRLEQTLAKQFEPAAQQATGADLLFEGPAMDWRVSDGERIQDLPEHHRALYRLKVERGGHQAFVQVTLPHNDPEDLKGTAQLGLFIEINQGRPCVHITNDVYGDQVLSVFTTEDGLLLRPESSDNWIRSGPASDGSSLVRLHAELTAGFPAWWGQNHCHIVNKV